MSKVLVSKQSEWRLESGGVEWRTLGAGAGDNIIEEV